MYDFGRQDFGRQAMFRFVVSRPPTIILKNVTEGNPKQALANLKKEHPYEYALLTEHLLIPEAWIPKEGDK